MSNSRPLIDHSRGHAFIHNGSVFYSPNSSRPIVVPDRPGSSTRYRFHKKDALWERFHEPQWWVEAYCFLSFVPLRPSFDGDTFGSLRSILPHVIGPGSDGRFYVTDDKIAQWTQLQDWLFYISALLDTSPSTYPALKPMPPSLLGFKDRHKSLRAARTRTTISRDWFVIWMGLLSFKVAAVPDWFNLLADKDVPQIWLHDFKLSTACNFSDNCPRVGIILDWLDGEKNKKQPPVEWFTSHHVPVWYPWTRAHAQASSKPRFAHLQPPVEILQAATTFSPIPPPSQSRQQPAPINPAPPTTANTSAHMTPKEFNAARKAYVRTKPWARFFEARAKQNEARLENESPKQRQTRLNRERKPPRLSAEVYEWDWSDEDPLVLVRTRILNKSREDTLDDYRSYQCRYDAFRNVWDVCQWFGLDDGDNSAPMDSDDESDDNYCEDFTGGSVGGYDLSSHIDEVDEHYNPEEEQATHSRYIANRTHEISTSRNAISWPSTQFHSDIEVDLSEDRNPFELLEHLQVFYGYVPPLETNSSLWIRKDWDDSMRAIGWFVDDNPPLKDFEAIVIKFIKDFTSSNPPPQNSDFNPQNYRAISPSKLKEIFNRFFYGKNESVYILRAAYLMDGEACPYSIALTNARDAIYIYRLLGVQDYSGITLCQFLLENGIPFRTLQRLDRIPARRVLKNDETLIPIRLSGYRFGPSDYEAYIRHRAQLLTSPRGRAALLRGGIVARIAREHIDTDSALFGPSSAVIVHRLGIHIVENNGSELWDDDLTENEIGIICGLHHCYTGMDFDNRR
jgi:hypothetical protein